MRIVGRCRSLFRTAAVTDSAARRSASFSFARLKLGVADLFRSRTQRRDRGHDVERRLPRAKSDPLPRRRSSRRARPRGGGRRASRRRRLRGRRCRTGSNPSSSWMARIEIARHREVDQEQRPSLARRQRARDLLAREHPAGALVDESTTSARASSSSTAVERQRPRRRTAVPARRRGRPCGWRRRRSSPHARRGSGRRARRPCPLRRRESCGRARSPNTCSASAAAADETDAGLSPIAVCARAFLPA